MGAPRTWVGTVSWIEEGLCWKLRHTVGGTRQALAVFYPEPGKIAMQFRLLCDRCPVRCDCLLWGVLAEDHGSWGGTDEDERREIRGDIAEGTFSLGDMLRARDCADLAATVDFQDAVAIAEAAQR